MPEALSEEKCTLLENRGTSKKPKWKVVCVQFPGCSGSVINSAKIPESYTVGMEIILRVNVVNGTQSQFTYPG